MSDEVLLCPLAVLSIEGAEFFLSSTFLSILIELKETSKFYRLRVLPMLLPGRMLFGLLESLVFYSSGSVTNVYSVVLISLVVNA